MLEFLVNNWYLVLVALVSGGLLLWPQFAGRVGAGAVGTTEAVRLVNREKAVLIDVSDVTEFAKSHPAGAKSIPLAKLETTSDLPKNKALPLVVVCPTGTRSARAVAILKKLGFENSKALAGGLAAWRDANLPVEKAA